VSRTLYVGNLPISATADTLTIKFAACGTVVSVKFAPLPATRRSNGVAFIEMANNTEAQTAINRFHMSSLDGRVISVNKMRAATEGTAARSRSSSHP
jgi:RNA recognition motif-containing protein